MRPVLVAMIALGLAGCSRREATPTNRDPAAAPAPSAPPTLALAVDASALSVLDAGARSPTAAAAGVTPPLEAELDNPAVRVPTSMGTVVVWSEADGTGSRLLAGRESKPGMLVNAAKVLRSTSGKIAAIDALTDARGDIVVTWVSDLGEKKGQLVALVTASPDLARVTAPTTIGIVAAQVALEAHVALAKNPRGGVIVAHEGPGVRCTFGPSNDETCITFEVSAVRPSGVVERIGKGQLDGGPSPEFRMIDVDGKALLVYASSMRGGRTLAATTVAYGPGDAPPAITPPIAGGFAAFMPEISRGASGEIVALCIDGLPDKGACMRPLRGDKERCLRIAVTGADGKSVTPKTGDVGVLRIECADAGAPRLVFPGGSVVLAAASPMAADFAPACAATPRK